jgi:hypothetical protein
LVAALTLSAVSVGTQDPQAQAYRDYLQAGNYVHAVSAAAGISDPLARHRAQVEARFLCGDLTGALLAVRQGLAAHPEDLQLLINGSDLALQLLQIEEGSQWSQRLVRLATESPNLPQESRDFYNRRAEGLVARSIDSKRSHAAQTAALLRAQCTVGMAVLLAIGFLVVSRLRPQI